jgi:aryl-alcohol dehydrogenase-like predicted oxidoreductase
VHPLERRVLPGLDEEVSALGAGCWTIGGPATNNGVPIGWDDVDEDDAYAGLVQAHELGVTLFDTPTSTAWAAPNVCSAASCALSTAHR